MERREALKALALLTGGAVLVPSCNFSKEDILTAYTNLQITPSLQQLLATVADTVIPAGTIKGAADISVQDFILVMINDCYEPQEQTSFMNGLTGFNDFSKKTGGKTFSSLEQPDREKVVLAGLAIEKKETPENTNAAPDTDQAVREFVHMTKRLTVQGFLMSQYIMTEVKPYQMLPGDYQGAVLLSDIKNEVIHG